ncbi:hypothetical protein HON22_01730 [Candidatus Peregrinibacteria bacterium]|nr:hypothetical protein [Candidatus Peregrinibacteria bacterium]
MFKTIIITIVLTLSSCSFGANIFDAQIPKHDFSQVQIPETKITRSEVVIKIKKGTSFISFPFLDILDTQIVLQNPDIIGIWQEDKNKKVSDINIKQSYFIQIDSDTEIRYNKSKTEIHSQFLEAEENYINIYKGEDELKASELMLNSQPISQALKNTTLESFYIFDSNGKSHNLKNTPFLDITLAQGAGTYIKSSAFSKISWPLSEAMQKQKDKEEKLALKEKERAEEKVLREREKIETAEKKQEAKNEQEILKILFKETKNLPETFLKTLKNQDQNSFVSQLADPQLLAQVHSFDKISENNNILQKDFWFKKEDWLKGFRVLEKNELQDKGSPHRPIIFLEFLSSENNSITGLESFFRAMSFIRAKDCSWKFDPIATHDIEKDIQEAGIISEKHFLSFIKSYELHISESEDFSQSRAKCLPETSFDIKKKKQFNIIEESLGNESNREIGKPVDDKKLIKLQKSCKAFLEILQNIDSKNLKEFVYNNEDETQIQGHSFPDTSFSESLCTSEWTNIILNENALSNNNTADSFSLFLGASKSISCEKIEDDKARDYCYFGAALKNTSSGSCKKITSDSVRSFCAGHIAQKKNKYKQCERVFGEWNEDTDEENTLKKVSLRNCHLDLLQENAESKKDCKVLKKSFLFFFTRSTESYEKCIELF